jgi:hypothetical protein
MYTICQKPIIFFMENRIQMIQQYKVEVRISPLLRHRYSPKTTPSTSQIPETDRLSPGSQGID